MLKKFDSRYRINYNNSDYTGKLSIPDLGSYVLDNSGLHSEIMGVNIRTIIKKNYTWVISGLHFEIGDLPTINSFIDIHTKLSSYTPISIQRDFFVTSDGKKVADISSDWLIINAETRQPVFLTDVYPAVANVISEDERVVSKYKHLRFNFAGCKPVSTFKIAYSDIDINKHMYSMKYLEKTLNRIDIDFFKNNNIRRIDANYLSEMLYNQDVDVFMKEIDNCYQFEMQIDGKPMYRAEIEFEKIK